MTLGVVKRTGFVDERVGIIGYLIQDTMLGTSGTMKQSNGKCFQPLR